MLNSFRRAQNAQRAMCCMWIGTTYFHGRTCNLSSFVAPYSMHNSSAGPLFNIFLMFKHIGTISMWIECVHIHCASEKETNKQNEKEWANHPSDEKKITFFQTEIWWRRSDITNQLNKISEGKQNWEKTMKKKKFDEGKKTLNRWIRWKFSIHAKALEQRMTDEFKILIVYTL